MDLFLQIVGASLVILALADIYLTVLYHRLGTSILSLLINKGMWKLFCFTACAIPFPGAQLLSFSGPTIIVAVVVVWLLLLLSGFALIFWPALGTAIQASQGSTPTDWMSVLYYSGYTLTTLGTGDLVPKTGMYRLLTALEAVLGFSTFTLTLTYFLSVYNELIKRNTLALSLHHRTAGTADAADLLARLGANGDFNNAQQDVSNMARDLMNLLESLHSYPVLLYFRSPETYYALPRIALLTLDTVTLIKSALNTQKYCSLVRSAAVAELWGGGLHMLVELSNSLLPKNHPKREHQREQAWRERYEQAVERLKAEGIETVTDLEAGANKYTYLRRQWDPYLARLTNYMGYKWSEIAPHS